MGLLSTIDRWKVQIHGTKIPLSKNGQRMMGLVYIGTPVLVGCAVMQWAMGIEERNRDWQRAVTPAPPITNLNLKQTDIAHIETPINKPST